jgi:two-component system, chemotaxis family, protein-glutamate methylesterase/glutaminase
MQKREIVVIGGSAGSMEGIKVVLKRLAAGLDAAVVVVIHLPARPRSFLAEALRPGCPVPVLYASDGQRVEKGKVYVAIPDYHLVIAKDHFHLTRGPKEGLHRPSINVTFRSAAASYGPSAVGVLLSGMLDDGASGLWEIVKHGGVSIVQDPNEALFSSMPMAALQDFPVHYTLRAAEIGALLNRVICGEQEVPRVSGAHQQAESQRLTGFTCPECRGPLFEKGGGVVEFYCRVGHVFSLPSLLEEIASTQERKMYEAIVALREGADMAQYAAEKLEIPDRQLLEEAEQLRGYADSIREMLENRNGASTRLPDRHPKTAIA